MNWTKINAVVKPDVLTAISVAQEDLLITLLDGQLFCAQNRCPHEGIKLSLGCLKGKRIKCSLHGFSFDLSTGKSDEAGIESLKIYPIKQENNNIYIKL